jgi:phosphotransferase system enzyme I (PtsI)
VLVGLGLEGFSVSPYLVPEIKTIVRSITYPEARALAERCLSLATPSEVRTVVTEFMSRRYPGIFLPA